MPLFIPQLGARPHGDSGFDDDLGDSDTAGLRMDSFEARLQVLVEQQTDHEQALQQQRQEYLSAIDSLRADLEHATKRIEDLQEGLQETKAGITVSRGIPPPPSLQTQGKPVADSPVCYASKCTAETYSHLGGSGMSYYAFGESIWDAAVLCVFREVCPADKMVLVCGVLINHGLQVILLAVVYFDMLENPIPLDQIRLMLNWRAGMGHTAASFDDVKGETLIRQLCDHNLWSFEQNEYETIFQYLYQAIPGYILSLLALILWVLTCTTEYRKTMEQALGLWSLPTVKHRVKCVIKDENDDSLRIVGIERKSRIVAMTLLTIPRLLIVVTICLVGCQYLAQTPSLADIVLNAVALAFVLDVDEQLFDVLCTQRIRTMVEDLRPLPCGIKATQCMGSVQWKDLIRYILCISAVVTAYFQWLTPFHAHVTAAASALCGGTYDFSYTGGTVSQNTLWLHNTSDFQGTCERDYVGEFHPGYKGGIFSTDDDATVAEDDLFKSSRRKVLNFAFSKRCPPGQVLEPDHSGGGYNRICTSTPSFLREAMDLIAPGITPGESQDPPRCFQFDPNMSRDMCSNEYQEGVDGDYCLWTSLSLQCEGLPPGRIWRESCEMTPGSRVSWNQVQKACAAWEAFNTTSPFYNCRVISKCRSTMDVNCFVMRGFLYLDVVNVPGLRMTDYSPESYTETIKRVFETTTMIPSAQIEVGTLPWARNWWRQGQPYVGPQARDPLPGSDRVSVYYILRCPVEFRPENFFSGDYESTFKEGMVSFGTSINETLGDLLEQGLQQVSMDNTQFLSAEELSLDKHWRDNPDPDGQY